MAFKVRGLVATLAIEGVFQFHGDVGALGTAGSLISTAYLIRHSVNVLANGVVAFCYNGPPERRLLN